MDEGTLPCCPGPLQTTKATAQSPFFMVYGFEAILLVDKLYAPSPRAYNNTMRMRFNNTDDWISTPPRNDDWRPCCTTRSPPERLAVSRQKHLGALLLGQRSSSLPDPKSKRPMQAEVSLGRTSFTTWHIQAPDRRSLRCAKRLARRTSSEVLC